MAFVALEPNQSLKLRELIKDWCGITVDDNGSNVLSFRMHPLLQEYQCNDYWEFIKRARLGTGGIKDAIIDAITTNETSWFRDQGIYAELRKEILPKLLEQTGKAGLDIWSAACSTGQEPYTLAMTISEMERERELGTLSASGCRIHASDISPAALAIAKKGHYDPVSMGRGLPPDLGKRYFTQTGPVSAVSTKLQKMITFKRLNLVDDYFGRAKFDLVLIRNVLIYFTDETKTAILKKMHNALRPGGLLVVGASENAQRFTDKFETVLAGSAMYYRRK